MNHRGVESIERAGLVQSRSDRFPSETCCFPLETQNALSIADNQFGYHTMNKEFPGINHRGVE